MRPFIGILFSLLAFAGCATYEHPVKLAPGTVIGANDRLPKALSMVPPQYTEELKKAGMQGVVTIEFIIAKDGSVVSAKAIDSPDPRLSALAEEAALKWTFEPGIRNGMPVACRMRAPLTFQIK